MICPGCQAEIPPPKEVDDENGVPTACPECEIDIRVWPIVKLVGHRAEIER